MFTYFHQKTNSDPTISLYFIDASSFKVLLKSFKDLPPILYQIPHEIRQIPHDLPLRKTLLAIELHAEHHVALAPAEGQRAEDQAAALLEPWTNEAFPTFGWKKWRILVAKPWFNMF